MHRENEKYHTNEDLSLGRNENVVNLNKFICRNGKIGKEISLNTYKLYVLHNLDFQVANLYLNLL